MQFSLKLKDCPPNSVITNHDATPNKPEAFAKLFANLMKDLISPPDDAWMLIIECSCTVVRAIPLDNAE